MPGQTKEAAAKAPPKAGKPKREGEAKKEQQQQTPPTQHQGKKNQDSAANANGQQNKQNVDRDDPKNNPFYEEEKPFRDRIQAINKQMDGVRKKIQEIQAILQKKQDDRKDIFARKTEITSKLSALETQRRAIQVEKRALNNQLKDHFKALETKKSQIEKVRDQLPFKNDKSEDFVARNNQIIDKELRKFEIQMSEKLSLQEEKKLVGEIAIWRNMKNLIKDYDIQAELESIDRVKATLKASQSKIDDIIGAEDVILGDLQKAHQDVIKNGVGIQALFKDKDKFVAQLEEFAGKRRDVQKELQQYRKTRAEERRELRKKQDEEREKQRKAREEERKKRQEEFLEERKKKQAAREAKELLSVPYEEDLALCDNLISYLEGLNKTKAKNPKADLKIQWEVFLSFEHISLVPPTSFADVDKSLEEVKAKKEYYQKLSQEKLKQRAEKKAAAETEGEKPKEPEEKTEEKPEEKTEEKTEERKEETKEETKEAESKGEEAKKEEAGGEN